MADITDPASSTAANAALPTNVSLRIITLAHGSNREDDLFLILPMETKVIELKERLKQLVSGGPSPEQQRLIYHGRPLLDGNATLRSILRFQAVDQIAHVLHLVVRTNAASLPSSDQSAATELRSSAHTPSQTMPQDETRPQIPHAPQNHPMPNPFQPMMNPAQLVEQANIFQQHMAIHNQYLANLHQGTPHPSHEQLHQRHVAHGPSLHPSHGQPLPGRQSPLTGGPQTGPNPNVTHHAPNMNQNATTMRIQETIGPNGERIRVVTNSTGPVLHHQFNHALRANPVERSASAPGTAERAGTPVPPEPFRPHQNPPLLQTAPVMPLRSQQVPRLIPNPPVLPNSANAATQNASPTVWLLSSPNGPQALLFSPDHGYYTTTPDSQPLTQHLPNPAVASNGAGQPQQDQPHVQQRPAPAGGPAPQPGAEIVVRPQGQQQGQPHGQPQALANVQARPQNVGGGDIAAFVLQRGWLFLRLYMFIFVLSEPGTWRRIILLGMATFLCFLPRRNPLTDAFNVARQYFDNLIGPPQPPQLLAQPANQQPRAQRPVPAVQGGVQPGTNTEDHNENRPNALPSTEEQARRALQNRPEQNQSLIRGLLYPIEQALALFFASLIPGVGERHVRAREQARRIIAEEQERRQREAEEQAIPEINSNETPSGQPENTDLETGSSKNESSAPTASPGPSNEATATTSGAETSARLESQSTSDSSVRQRAGVGSQQPLNTATE